MPILEANHVFYRYESRRRNADVLKDVSCAFDLGTIYALVGRSGSGKSTLLSLLSGQDLPSAGEVLFDGVPTADMNRDAYRRQHVAVVYQNFSLFPLLTVAENIMYPMELCGIPKKEARQRAEELSERVGLPHALLTRFPGRISGGEQQRVAIARALTMDRRVLLADEPTGNLDAENSDTVIRLLTRLAHEDGCCVIVATHDADTIRHTDTVLRLDRGMLMLSTGWNPN